jgi:hypothetical protein
MCVQLDLYSVAEHNNYEHKLMTLSDMLYELLAPYGEVRVGAASPSEEQAFYLRHGETTDSLKVRRAGMRPLWPHFCSCFCWVFVCWKRVGRLSWKVEQKLLCSGCGPGLLPAPRGDTGQLQGHGGCFVAYGWLWCGSGGAFHLRHGETPNHLNAGGGGWNMAVLLQHIP